MTRVQEGVGLNMTEGFVEVEGVKLRYAESGTGPALVLVHGWGMDLHSWDAQIRFFQDRFRVIAYDWRGHGGSELTPPYSFSALPHELDGVLTALNVDRPLLCGHSMGGTIVMEYATTYTRPLAGLLLVDTNVPGSRLDQIVFRTRCVGGSTVTEALARLTGSRRALTLVSGIYGRSFWAESWRRAHPSEYSAWRRHFAGGNSLGMARACRASVRRMDPVPRLRTLSLPVLVVQGTVDRVFSVTMARRIACSVKGATLALVEGAGHMSMCEQPDQVHACIDGFLRQLAPEPTSVGGPPNTFQG